MMCFYICFHVLGQPTVSDLICCGCSSETREEKMSAGHKHSGQSQSPGQEKQRVQISIVDI